MSHLSSRDIVSGMGRQISFGLWSEVPVPVVAEPTADARAGQGWSSNPLTLDGIDRLALGMAGARQAISVNDAEMRIVFSNDRWNDILRVPDGLRRAGQSIHELIDFLALRGEYGPGSADRHASFRKRAIVEGVCFRMERGSAEVGSVLVGGCPLPGGGYVTTLTELPAAAGPAVPLAVARAHLGFARGRQVAVLRELLEPDPELGIPGRGGFDLIARCLAESHDGSSSPGAVLWLSLKAVPGPEPSRDAGALLRRAVAQEMRARLRAGDLLAGDGGDGFLVLLPGTGMAGALAVAEALRRIVAATVLSCGTTALAARAAIGVDLWGPGEAGVDDALGRAAAALREAVAAGGDCFRRGR